MNECYLRKTVRVRRLSSKRVSGSIYECIANKVGTVTNIINSNIYGIGVKFNDIENCASSYGVFWLSKDEIETLDDEKLEGEKMEGFKYVAIVNFLDSLSSKDYAFALYEEEEKLIQSSTYPALVVVNPRGKENRVLGMVKEIKTAEEYGNSVSAQVVGVVNTDGFNKREEEIKHKAEIKKQKDKIESELKERLRKLESAAFYEKMAKEYEEKDPELSKLVEQLKELGE